MPKTHQLELLEHQLVSLGTGRFGVKLERLVLWETPRNSVEYSGE